MVILLLVATACYSALGSGADAKFIVIACSFVALVYFMGFFRYMPEILGGRAPSEPLLLRFKLWLRFSGLSALATGALLLLMVSEGQFFLIAGVPTVYLAVVFLMGFQDAVTTGLRAAPAAPPMLGRLWISLGLPARVFWRRIPVRVGLGAGSVLVLSSLFLITSMSYGCSTSKYRGYQVVTGEGRWVTAENMNSDSLVGQATRWAGWTMYLGGLLAASIGIGASVRKWKLESHPIAKNLLLWLSGTAAVFAVSDLGIFWVHINSWFIPQLIFWGLPTALCIRYFVRSRKGRSHPEEGLGLKMGLLVFYFPVVLVTYGTVAVVIATPPIAWGYIAYFIGIQLLWICTMKADTAQPISSDASVAVAAAQG